MARFSPSNYDPSKDSSPGAPNTGNLVIVLPDEFSCRCGCKGKPKSPKRSFIQGHDARLKGMLIRAAVTDTKVEIHQGKDKATTTAAAAAKVFGFASHVTAAKSRHADAEKARKAKAAAKPKASKKAPTKKAASKPRKRTTKAKATTPAPAAE